MKNFYICFIIALLLVSPSAAQEKIRVACVGNSVTYGTGIKDRAHDSYPAQLQRLLGERYEVGNFGRPCATLIEKGPLPYVQVEEYQKALDFKADLVIIHLGLNDTDPICWPCYADVFNTDYRRLIQSFQTANPKARIWICRMTPIFHPHKRFLCGTRDWHRQIQQHIEQVAQMPGIGLIDFYEPLHHRIELFRDALHPDPEGAAILAQKVYSAITGDFGGLTVPPTYGDGMVLQRERPLTICGGANAGELVTVSFNGQTLRTNATTEGTWRAVFPPQTAGGPYTLDIQAESGRLTFHNVWTGEVWLCSGQSNMAFPLDKCVTAEKDINHASHQPLVHLYDMRPIAPTSNTAWSPKVLEAVNQLHYFSPGQWSCDNPRDAARFSAIAYHFGRHLADSLQCPVGLICNAVGGATTESWVDRTTLEYEYPAILYNWRKSNYIQPWALERAAVNLRNSKHPLQRHPFEPAYLFESGILPLKDYALRGVIWYQGESNAHNLEIHEQLFPLLVNSWRRFWNDEALDFHFVQLSSITSRPSWPSFRDSQRRMAQKLTHTWMTVSSDLGNATDVHPRQKAEIGQRLALSALRHTYQWQQIVPSGPELIDIQYQGDCARLSFRYGEGLHPAQGEKLIGFEIAGSDGIYYPAQATITSEGVTLCSPAVKIAKTVRYAWQPFSNGNLVNAQGMPASTFKDECTE